MIPAKIVERRAELERLLQGHRDEAARLAELVEIEQREVDRHAVAAG